MECGVGVERHPGMEGGDGMTRGVSGTWGGERKGKD